METFELYTQQLNAGPEPRGLPRRLHALVRCGVGLRLVVRHNYVLEHGKLLLVERHQWDLPPHRRRSNEGIWVRSGDIGNSFVQRHR